MIVFFATKRLAFGSKVRLNRHVEKLRGLGITHVVDVRMYPSKKLRKFKTIHLNFKDNARPRPMWFYAQALRFYREALERPNSKIYVMCRGGRRWREGHRCVGFIDQHGWQRNWDHVEQTHLPDRIYVLSPLY
jgi:hypothetical protein